MYVPYLYGRQEETLALAELAPGLASHGRVVPLVEPVQLNDQLHKKLSILRTAGAKAMVVANPTRGHIDTVRKQSDVLTLLAPDLADVAHIRPVFRESEGQGLPELLSFLASYPARPVGVLLTTNLISEVDLAAALSGLDYLVLFAPSVSAMGYSTLIPLNRTIDVGERFIGRSPNAEFIGLPDEFFGNDLLTWRAAGRAGFSDYTVLPPSYTEGGGGAVALVVHLTFMDTAGLRVQHFASSAGSRGVNSPKWAELLQELEDTLAAHPTRFEATSGLASFRAQYSSRSYTSPGSSKRQQIIHHIQTVAARMTI